MNQAFAINNLQHTANTFLMLVHSNMVAGRQVHRDYGDMMSKHEDVVCVGPDRVQCVLADWNVVSFLMRSEEASKSFADITNEYIEPAAVAMAGAIDRSVLFNMAARAGHRRGTPGGGLPFPEDLGGKVLIIPPSAQADLVIDKRFIPTPRENDGTALDYACLSKDQIFMDQSCPGVFTSLADYRLDQADNHKSEVIANTRIGNTALLFNMDGVVLGCRPLPPVKGLDWMTSTFGGLQTRVQVEKFQYPEDETVYDRVTFDILTGVAVNPELVTAIYV